MMTRSAAIELADKLLVKTAELDPVRGSLGGYAGHESRLTDYSPEGYGARAQSDRRFLDDARKLQPQDHRDEITQRLVIERLSTYVERYEAGDHLWDLSVGGLPGSPPQAICLVFDRMPKRTKEEWEHVAARMAAVEASVRGWQLTLTSAIDNGWAPSQRQLNGCITQARIWSGGQDGVSPFFRKLSDEYASSSRPDRKLADKLDRSASTADAAMGAYASFLAEYCMNAATPHDAAGRERYERGVHLHLGASIDIDEAYAWGWEETLRLQRETAEVCSQIAPGATLTEISKRLNADHERLLHGDDELVDWLESLLQAVISRLDGVHFDIPLPVKNVAVRIAPMGGLPFPYYTQPSENFDVPGTYWFPTNGRTRFPMWSEISTAYHEGVPGHHLQMGWARATEGLSRYQRGLFVPGHGEGWALYAERLMDELGFLNRPEYRLDMLLKHAFRAARVVVDIGLHLQLPIPSGQPFHPGEMWTPELAQEFIALNSNLPDDQVTAEITRYLGMPGQALAYKLGEREWLRARDSARAAAGSGFDLKTWHANALSLGSMGLDQLHHELETLSS
jgi:uncharacterized protein (DUF885 family)